MEPLDPYRKLARSLTRAGFAARYPCPFLVKPPVNVVETSSDGTEEDPWGDKISFQTRVLDPESEPDLIDEAGPIALEWRVVEVKKREGNPFPDRISVGRAKNCDIVLRFPSVSKLHAHFLVKPGEPALRLDDKQSANRTLVNGHALVPGTPKLLASGDRVRFGALEVQYLDADAFHVLLLRT